MWSLGDALAWLDRHDNLELAPVGAAPTLDRMQALVEALGSPHAAVPVIHVTGTNGKGSTCAMIAALLKSAGLRVGVYSSPHLSSPLERIVIDGEPVAERDFIDALYSVALAEEHQVGPVLWFEAMTAAAYRVFADDPVHVAVIEVGMGGRWDATNVATGDVAVICSVGLDHIEYLGDTREAIAAEKSGIIKADSAVVVAEMDPEVRRVIERCAHQAGAREVLFRPDDFDVEGNELAVGGRLLDLHTPRSDFNEVFVSLHGRFQGANAAAAVVAVEAFVGSALDPEVVAEALGTVRLAGRAEVLAREPVVLADVAHNPAGASALGELIEETFPEFERPVLVVGMLAPRDPRAFLEALGVDERWTVIAPDVASPRAIPADEVVRGAQSLGATAQRIDDLDDALDDARDLAGTSGLVVITGSFRVVGPARELLRGH
jgi:dihydrofolate synthase/folylpolyglutamate synthase